MRKIMVSSKVIRKFKRSLGLGGEDNEFCFVEFEAITQGYFWPRQSGNGDHWRIRRWDARDANLDPFAILSLTDQTDKNRGCRRADTHSRMMNAHNLFRY